ncbi:MAG TPA: LysR family transcriptional regulator [Xanthobacteraceae bacterium]|jgi:DNA-binding transcriptional LysR family regulator|nr:LysR family transcriptional regulator [Xanthobacteraceae bacterium]
MFPATFRRLQVFLAVAEAGSFVSGAEKLGISRPSVSEHIHALERDVGFALFKRRRGTHSGLTAEGRRLYETGVDILERAEQFAQELTGKLGQQPKRRRLLRVAAHRFLLNELLTEPLAEFARDHGDIELQLETGSYNEVIDNLRGGTVDIGFFIAAGEKIEIATEIVGTEPIGLYVSQSHPLAQRNRVTVEEISRYPFVAAPKGSRSNLMLERVLTQSGIVGFPVVCRTSEDVIARQFAIDGLAVASFFSRTIADDVAAQRLVRLPSPAPSIEIEIHRAFSPWRRTDRAARQLAAYLKRKRAFH